MGAIVSSIGAAKSMQSLSKLSTAMEKPETETGQAAAQLVKDVGDRMVLAGQRATDGFNRVFFGIPTRDQRSPKKKPVKDPFSE